MSKLNRILWSGLVLGIAACGDSVTVTQPPEPVPGIRSVTVAPDGAQLAVGASLQMTAAVTTDPGAAAPTIAWSSSDAAKATVGATSGTVTGVAAGAAGIRATATVGTSTGSGVATVTVVAAPTCSVTGVSVSPADAALVTGQTLAVAANVNGTNCTAAQLAVGFISSNLAVATVNATSGLVTAVGAGSATITATSVTDASKKAALSVSVTVPAPTTVSIQSITQFATNLPVDLSNVGGQVEVTLNVDPGAAPSITKAQILIGGLVVAEQIYASASAAASAGPELAAQTLVLSTNTRQVRLLSNGLYVPVVFNGPSGFSARVFVATSSTPAASNAVPVVMQNADAIVKGPDAATPATPSPSFTNDNPADGTTWYTGNVDFTGGNYISFYPVTPDAVEWWSETCGWSDDATSGTPQTGLTFAGQFDCGGEEDAVEVAGFLDVTPGTAPAADVIYIPVASSCDDIIDSPAIGSAAAHRGTRSPAIQLAGPSDCYEQTGTAYTINGDATRHNLLSGGEYSSPDAVYIDNVAPEVDSWDFIGYLNGCEIAATEGCWVNASYAFADDMSAEDFGSGLASMNFFNNWSGIGPYACSSTAVTTGNDYAANATKNAYLVCNTLTDNLGNVSGPNLGPNPFSVDKTAPTFSYVETGPNWYDPTSSLGTYEDVFNAIPALKTLDYKIIDENSGIDAAVGVVLDFSYLVNDGTLVGNSTTACSAPGVGLTGPGGAGVPRQLTTPFAPDAGCDAAGYYYYDAHGEDRAGNQSDVVSVRFGLDRAIPQIDAVNLTPLYGGGMPVNATVFASEVTVNPLDGADLANSNMGIGYVGNAVAAIPYQVIFPAAFFPVFGAPWDASLYLRTPATGAIFSAAGGIYALGALIDDPAQLGGGIGFTSLVHIVRNVYGTPSATAVTPIPNVFKDLTTVAPTVTNTVWTAAQAAKVQLPDFAVIGDNCTMTYGTPTNGPVILSRVWLVGDVTLPALNLIEEVAVAPALISDNGTTREYRVTFAAATCPATGRVIAVQADGNSIPHGYLFTPTP